jgi:hypothetical protein
MSEIELMRDANIRSQSYFIATATTRCWHCGLSTRVLALAVPGGHKTMGESGRADAWDRSSGDAFLFYVEQVSDSVRKRLAAASPFFHVSMSTTTLNSYWASHCENCGTLLEDHELHCEPDGAFAPSNEQAATCIRLLQVHEPFEAVSAGYAPEPEFLSFMRKD